MKKIFILILIILTTPLYSQGVENPVDLTVFYYIGPTIGRATNTENGESVFNLGISFTLQQNKHLFNVFYQALFELGPEALNGSDKEFSITYTRMLSLKKFFIGMGSGISVLYITRRYKTISDEHRERIQTLKLGIPLEFRIGFLYPDQSMRLLDLNFFTTYNSKLVYWGWKLHFNIKL
jgi:hypothetical protein